MTCIGVLSVDWAVAFLLYGRTDGMSFYLPCLDPSNASAGYYMHIACCAVISPKCRLPSAE